MSLRRKMTLQIGAMIVGLLLITLAALWGLNGLRQDYGLALTGYQQLRRVYDVGAKLSTAQTILAADPHHRTAALHQVEKAQLSFKQSARTGLFAPLSPQSRQMLADISDSIAKAVQQLQSDGHGLSQADLAADDQRAVGMALPKIGSLTGEIHDEIGFSEQSARDKLRHTMLVVGVSSAAIIVAAILLGMAQYLGVMRPLQELNAGVRRIARGHFTDRLTLGGGEEFAALAQDFNRMAGELDGFYHLLEEKVASNTRELIRTERLASVGFLAAGVAHEINNPLGVIAGYAEYSIQQLNHGRLLSKENAASPQSPGCTSGAPNGERDALQSPGCTSGALKGELAGTAVAAAIAPAVADSDPIRQEVANALQIICEEAFRCKDITTKLLTLAHPGEGVRQRVSMATVASAVVAMAGGLRQYRDRHLTVSAQPGADLTVLAVEAEMKQVVLNLVVNALEAAAPQIGSVLINVTRKGDAVLLSVTDNGRGMTPQTIERVFEPFFTDRPTRDSQERGTGLGLSITHAIIKEHGGRMKAESDGPGKGSRFTVELPAAASVAAGDGSPT